MKWEYLKANLQINIDECMRAFGQQAWELVAVLPVGRTDEVQVWFKRPIKEVK